MSKKDLKLSVIIVAYNHEKFLKKCIDSVLDQNVNFNFEIIIRDDCSTDQSRKIIQSYKNKHPDKIKLLFNKRRKGPVALDSFKITSNSQYITILEGDDYWCDSNKLKLQTTFLDKNPGYIGCGHNSEIVWEQGSSKYECNFANGVDNNMVVNALDIVKCRMHMHTSSLIWRNIFNNNFNPESFRKISSDSFWLLFYGEMGYIKYFHKFMSTYRINAKGISSGLSPIDRIYVQLNHSIKLNKYFKYKFYYAFENRLLWNYNLLPKEYQLTIQNKNRFNQYILMKILKLKLLFKYKIPFYSGRYFSDYKNNFKYHLLETLEQILFNYSNDKKIDDNKHKEESHLLYCTPDNQWDYELLYNKLELKSNKTSLLNLISYNVLISRNMLDIINSYSSSLFPHTSQPTCENIYEHEDIGFKIVSGDYIINIDTSLENTALSSEFFSKVGDNGKVFLSESISTDEFEVEKDFIAYAAYYSRIISKNKTSQTQQKVFIDSFIKNNSISKLSIIRVNTESDNLNILINAENSIRNFKPKILIHLRHNIDEFETIPKYIDSLGLNYKFYIKNFNVKNIETILYCQ